MERSLSCQQQLSHGLASFSCLSPLSKFGGLACRLRFPCTSGRAFGLRLTCVLMYVSEIRLDPVLSLVKSTHISFVESKEGASLEDLLERHQT